MSKLDRSDIPDSPVTLLYGLFEHMLNACALVEMEFSGDGRAENVFFHAVNPAFERFTGLTRRRVVGRRYTEVIPPWFPAEHAIVERIGAIAGGAKPECFDLHLSSPKGYPPVDRWISLSVYSPNPGWCVVMFDDITERKRWKEELLKLSSAVEQSPGMVMIIDLAGRIEYVNPRFTEVTGYGAEMLGLPVIDLATEVPREMMQRIWNGALSGQSWRGELLNRRSDGGTYWEMASISPIRDESGEIVNLLKVGEDITDRMESEEELKDSEEKYRVLFERTKDAIMIIDGSRIMECNEAVLSMFRSASREEIIGRSFGELSAVTKNREGAVDCTSVEDLLDEVRRRGSFEFEWEFRRMDATEFPADVSMTTIQIHGMSIINCVARDTTQRRRTMRSSHLASLGEMAAGVAHEINNPANSIDLVASHLLDHPEFSREDVEEHLRGISRDVRRIAGIVRSLLSFSRADVKDKQPVALQQIVDDTFLLIEKQMTRAGVRCLVEIAESLPPVMCNARQIGQVLLNLMSNSIYSLNEKYSEADLNKLLKISASLNGEEDSGAFVKITVLDQGMGIPAEHLDKVMNPFHTTKPVDKGTGLGLSICNGIVTDHGGHREIRSEEGGWTEVSFTLPTVAPVRDQGDEHTGR